MKLHSLYSIRADSLTISHCYVGALGYVPIQYRGCVGTATPIEYWFDRMVFLIFMMQAPEATKTTHQTQASQSITAIKASLFSISARYAAAHTSPPSSYDIREIKVQLYGSGYVNQHAVWQQDEKGRLVIKLAQYPVTDFRGIAQQFSFLQIRPIQLYGAIGYICD